MIFLLTFSWFLCHLVIETQLNYRQYQGFHDRTFCYSKSLNFWLEFSLTFKTRPKWSDFQVAKNWGKCEKFTIKMYWLHELPMENTFSMAFFFMFEGLKDKSVVYNWGLQFSIWVFTDRFWKQLRTLVSRF